jgi:monoamine oxidase
LKDGKTSVVVAFGAANTEIPSQHPEQIRKWIGGFDHRLSNTYQGSVWHEWNEDEYARGTWNMFDKGMYTKFWSALQQRTGNVLWASADWADGWKSFIDGAIEQGTKAAFIVRQELLQTSTSVDAANAGV